MNREGERFPSIAHCCRGSEGGPWADPVGRQIPVHVIPEKVRSPRVGEAVAVATFESSPSDGARAS